MKPLSSSSSSRRRQCRPWGPLLLLLLLLVSSTLAGKVTSLLPVESTAESLLELPQTLQDELSALFTQSSLSSNNDAHHDEARSLVETTTSDDSSSSLICQLHINRILPNDGQVVSTDEDREFTTCSLWNEGTTTGAYLIHPPAWVLEQHRLILVRGLALYLTIPGGYITTTGNDQIIIPNPQTVTVLLDPSSSSSHERQLQRVSGAKKTVMLRIRGKDAQPDFTMEELYSYLLTHDLSARRQLERCSQGLVTLDASRYGILDVPLDTDIDGLKHLQVMNLAETYVNQVILATDTQVDNIRDWADMLIFVLPPGTGNWAAFATVSGKQSVFNNRWGGYLGALLHELGHNLGLDHVSSIVVKSPMRVCVILPMPEGRKFSITCCSLRQYRPLKMG